MHEPDSAPGVITIKFLVTDLCNIACTFCHNEFQGDFKRKRRGDYVAFEQVQVTSLLGEISDNAKYPVRVKISGGEPLLLPDQVSKLMNWSKCANPRESILMSNFAAPAGADDEWLARLGFSEVRINIPSLVPGEYSELTGNIRLPISKVLDRCSRVKARGLHVRFNAVVAESRVARVQRFVRDYLRALDIVGVADEVVFILDARYSDQTAGVQALTAAVESYTCTMMQPRSSRKWQTTWRGITIGIARCIMWRTNDPATRAADIYVRPPGVRQAQFAPGRAFLALRGRSSNGI